MDMINDKELAALLEKIKTIAVVGAVDKQGRAVNMIGKYLIHSGYNVIPVHPKRKNVWGLETFKTLEDIPVPVDLVNLFRASQYCPAHAEETLKLSPLPKCFWMQSEITSPEAQKILEPTGMTVVQDHCIMFERERLLGGK